MILITLFLELRFVALVGPQCLENRFSIFNKKVLLIENAVYNVDDNVRS